MSDQSKIKIGEAKGRPMLHWVGKQPLDYVKAFPAQKVEVFNPTGEINEAQGLLFHGDNKDVLAWLLANGYRGEIDLIYIDPPFDSGADYVRTVELRGIKGDLIAGEAHSLGEQIQYTDIWANDMYLQFMYERLLLLKELLSVTGSLILHVDHHKSHLLRCILDEIFGVGLEGKPGFRNEIIWGYGGGGAPKNFYPSKHDNLLWYSKGTEWAFNKQFRPYSEKTIDRGLTQVKGDYELDEEGAGLVSWWTDDKVQKILSPTAYENLKFPTQKPESLLRRIILGHSNKGNLILDCFIGSGTTAAVAQKLGRRWIAADINKGAIQTTSKRLQSIIQNQIKEQSVHKQARLGLDGQEEQIDPAALSFTVYRVNDYDLQIQHNEAAKLAVEHIGIEQNKSDTFFDGTLGDQLVKIIPFNHPLTLLDLQMVKDEIETRDDQRDIVTVALGKETRVDPWLADYNSYRPINRIKVIELRTDEKYGKFFVHKPAQSEVTIKRVEDKIIVDIKDFISPSIVERLEINTPLFKAKIPDWRAMVDCVMIDLDYDGEVFDIDLSDVPEKKDDFVVGHYELPAPYGETIVAVKIIDMLGEEVLITKDISK